jgi:hypothetical protein
VADNRKADDYNGKPGDGHHGQRLTEQEPPAKRRKDRTHVEDQTRLRGADLIEQIEVRDVGDSAGEDSEIGDRDNCREGPLGCGRGFAAAQTEAVEHDRTD